MAKAFRDPITGTSYVICSSGTKYTPDANGMISGVTNQGDIRDLVTNGFAVIGGNAANGLDTSVVRISDMRATTGAVLATAAAAGAFGVSYAETSAGQVALVGETAQTSTKTDAAIFEHVLPANYIAGQPITLTVNGLIVGGGTPGSLQCSVAAFLLGNAGLEGANIGPTATGTLTTAAADMPFVVSGATLNPTNRLLFEVQTIISESGGASTVKAQINSLRVN